MKTYQLEHRLEGHHHNVCKCQFSPDGAILATASYDTRVILWDAFRGTQIMQLQSVTILIISLIIYYVLQLAIGDLSYEAKSSDVKSANYN